MNYTILDAKKEALRQTERRTEAQQAFAIAADQRAIQFCAALGIIVTILAQSGPDSGTATILRLEAMVTLLVAAIMSAYSCRPVLLYSASEPSNGMSDYFHEEYAEDIIESLTARNDEAIARNDKRMKVNQKIFSSAMIIAVLGIGLVILRLFVMTFAQGSAK